MLRSGLYICARLNLRQSNPAIVFSHAPYASLPRRQDTAIITYVLHEPEVRCQSEHELINSLAESVVRVKVKKRDAIVVSDGSYRGDQRKAKPHEDEMQSVPQPRTIIELGKKKSKKKEINLVDPGSRLQLWTKMEPRGLIAAYLQLSKSKLTLLITSTAVAGFLMAPVDVALLPLATCAAGTALLSSSANACNQLLEAPYDAQMKRTQNRVLVVHRFSPLHALSFASVAAVSGAVTLYLFASPLSAVLGILNLVLYGAVYTPLKRTHIACTWIGAVVGAIPPLMGYAAATGTIDASALCLAAILYSWQFPHFNGLSWNLRGDYSKAGYHVMCVTNERLCRVTSIRHSLALVGLCSVVAPLTNLTTITFALGAIIAATTALYSRDEGRRRFKVGGGLRMSLIDQMDSRRDSLPVNAYMCWLAYKFYRSPDADSSRRLFFYSLFYLPLIMTLMVVSNYGRNLNQKPPVKERVQSAHQSTQLL